MKIFNRSILNIYDDKGNKIPIPAIKGDKGLKGDKGDKGEPYTHSAEFSTLAEQVKQDALNSAKSEANAKTSETNAKQYADSSKLSAEESAKQSEKLIVALPKPTQEGESVLTLTDSTDYRVLDAEVKGTTKQNPIRHLTGSVISADNVSGGQVCPTKVESANLLSLNGFDFDLNNSDFKGTMIDENTIRIVGTNCSSSYYNICVKSVDGVEWLEPNSDISFVIDKPIEVRMNFTMATPQNNIIEIEQGRTSYFGKVPNEKITQLKFIVDSVRGKTFDYTIKLQINKGKEPLPYTPYVENLQSAEVSAMGKNFAPTNELTNTTGNEIINCNIPHNVTISMKKSNDLQLSESVWRVKVTKADGDKSYLQDGRLSATFSGTPQNPITEIYTRGQTITKGKYYDLQYEIGDSATAFEPTVQTTYPISSDGTVNNVQSVSPNMTLIGSEGITIDTILPEPIVNGELKAIGDNGKNIFNTEDVYNELKAIAPNEVKWVELDGYKWLSISMVNAIYKHPILQGKFEQGKKYTMSFIGRTLNYEGEGTGIKLQNKKGEGNILTPNSPTAKKYEVVSHLSDLYEIGWYWPASAETLFRDIQVAQSDKLIPYELYKGQTLTLSQPYELSKWDSIFRDSDGLWKKKDNILRLENLQSINWVPYKWYKAKGFYGKYTSDRKLIPYDKTSVLSNVFKAEYNSNLEAEYQFYVSSSETLNISFEGTMEKFIKFLENSKAYIEGKTETPIITTLPQADQDLLNQLVTFYPQTTLTTDEGIILNVKYLADIEHFVERKFNELSQSTSKQFAETNKAIVSLGGI